MKSVFSLLLAISVLTAASASAQDAESLQILTQQQQSLKADLESGGMQGLSPRQGKLIRKAQTEFFQVTEGKSSLDDLSIDEKVRMQNALETINAELVGTRSARDSQEVCWREAKTGSSMKITRCGTQEERDRVRDDAQRWMEKTPICSPPGCGG